MKKSIIMYFALIQTTNVDADKENTRQAEISTTEQVEEIDEGIQILSLEKKKNEKLSWYEGEITV